METPDIAANEGAPARLNDSEREALLLNIDVSLRVHTRPQLFSWVQGALQSLIPHEVLVCGLQESRQGAMRVDSFSTGPVDCSKLSELWPSLRQEPFRCLSTHKLRATISPTSFRTAVCVGS